MERPEPEVERTKEPALVNATSTRYPFPHSAARSRRKLSISPRSFSFSFRVRKKSFFQNTLPYATGTSELFNEPRPVSVFQSISNDLSWYHPWLRGQITSMSHVVRQLRVGEETLLEKNAFERVFATVATFVRNNEGPSVDDVVEHLLETQNMERTPDAFKAQRLLVFAILGWQSMLYRPAFNTCTQDEFAVHEDDDETNSCLIFDTNKVSADLADRPLSIILKGFGNLLPSPSIAQATSESSRAASTWLPLDPTETNAHFLHILLHVKIRWVDCLALHLDYNKSRKTLSLFSCPSFCVAMLQSKGTIFSFASTEQKSFDPRASEGDISQFMREILLSFRLLFGQHGPSRKLFPQIYKPPQRLVKGDELLPALCMTRSNRRISESLPLTSDQPVYFAAQHFPVLSERIELLAKELKNSRPSSIGALLRDRRDTLQYWTFWLVSIFGGISIILSLVQVILQAIQLVQG